MIKRITKKTFLFLLFLTSLFTVAYAKDSSDLEIKSEFDTYKEALLESSVTYEPYFYDNSGQLSPVEFHLENGETETIKSGDTFKLKPNSSVVIKDIPVGYSYTIYQYNIPNDFEVDEKEVSGEIKDSETAQANFTYYQPRTILAYPSLRVNNVTDNSDIETSFNIESVSGDSKKYTLSQKTAKRTGTGPVLFDPIEFIDSGTFTFKIKQTTKNSNLILDETEYIMKVVTDSRAEYRDRTISYFIGTDPVDEPVFTNERKLKSITYKPKVKKIITGDTPSDKEFTFKLQDKNQDDQDYELPANKTIKVKASQEKTFDAITFNKEGNYSFQILEEKANLFGYSFDESIWNLDISVAPNESHTALEITKATYKNKDTSLEDIAIFNNIYNSGSLKLSKTVQGKENDQTEFSFSVMFTDDKDTSLEESFPVLENEMRVKSGDTLKLKNNESLTITKLPSGTKFKIEEINLPNGYHVESAVQSGVIETESLREINYLNTYSPIETEFKPTVTKSITGDIPENQKVFSFTIESETSEGINLPENNILEIEGSGTKTFEPITFSKDGNYIFTIKETDSEYNGYDFDKTVWEVEVNVVDNNGNLEVNEVTYKNKTTQETNKEGAAFVNNYYLTPVNLPVKITKQINGEIPNELVDFDFVIDPVKENPKGFEIANTDLKISGENRETSTNITFSKVGTYNFTIKEKDSGKNYITFDKTNWNCRVEVIDNESVLSATATYFKQEDEDNENQDGPIFVNEYLSQNLTLTKQVVGTQTQEKFNHRIELYDSNNEVLTGSYPVDSNIENLSELKSNALIKLGHNESITIKNLPLGSKYKVTEEDIPLGYTPRENPLNGQIEKIDINLSMVNDYKALSTSYTPSILKAIEGSPLESKQFSFILTGDEENPKDGDNLKDSLTGIITGVGTVKIDDLIFNTPGNYKYYITENQGEDKGYSYDPSTWELYIEVSDNAGQLQVTNIFYQKNEEEPTDHATFINTYNPEVVTFTAQIEKVVTGDTPEDKLFTFNLQQELEQDGVILPNNNLVKLSGSDSGNFDPITFSKPGDFFFLINEIPEDMLGYSFDDSIWELEVLIEDQDGSLAVTDSSYVIRADLTDLPLKEIVEDPAEFNDNPINYEFSPDYEEISMNNEIGIITQEEVFSEKPQETIRNINNSESNESITSSFTRMIHNLIEQFTPPQKATFNNTFSSGNLELTKEVAGELGDKNKEFTFNIHLKDTNNNYLSGSFPYEGDLSGKLSSNDRVKLKSGERIRVSSIPLGCQFEITEDEENEDGYITESQNASGIISEELTETVFVNEKTNNTGKITISKEVKGDSGDNSFNFTLTIFDKNQNKVNEEYAYSGSRTGVINSSGQFELSANEAITITGLKEGYKYEITEDQSNNYTTTSVNSSGDITSDTSVTFTNIMKPLSEINSQVRNISTPQTGDNSITNLLILILLIIGLGLVILVKWNKVKEIFRKLIRRFNL